MKHSRGVQCPLTLVFVVPTQLSTKSCVLDIVPTSLMKYCPGDLVLVVTQLINYSLLSLTVPCQYKRAVVTPLLKKESGLDVSAVTNLRPVISFSFLSKVLDKTVLDQLQNRLSANRFLKSGSPFTKTKT